MTAMLGATPNTCGGGERKLEGLMSGGGSSVGKPRERRVSRGTEAHPCVVELFCAIQEKAIPGTEFAAAVAKKVATGSKEIPQPARITVFSPHGVQVKARRGANAVALERFHQLSARTKETRPCEPSTGLSGTNTG